MENPTHTENPQIERSENARQESSASLWHKLLVSFGSTLVKVGNTLLSKMGEDEQQATLPYTNVDPVYVRDSGTSSSLHPVGHEDSPASAPKDDPAPEPKEESSLSGKELLKRSVELINLFDRQASETEDESLSQTYKDAASQIIENLILSGCTCINPQEDESFNFDCHTTNPISFPSDQCVKRTVRLGVALNDRILVKAIVELK